MKITGSLGCELPSMIDLYQVFLTWTQERMDALNCDVVPMISKENPGGGKARTTWADDTEASLFRLKEELGV
jgi:hypothetical protein